MPKKQQPRFITVGVGGFDRIEFYRWPLTFSITSSLDGVVVVYTRIPSHHIRCVDWSSWPQVQGGQYPTTVVEHMLTKLRCLVLLKQLSTPRRYSDGAYVVLEFFSDLSVRQVEEKLRSWLEDVVLEECCSEGEAPLLLLTYDLKGSDGRVCEKPEPTSPLAATRIEQCSYSLTQRVWNLVVGVWGRSVFRRIRSRVRMCCMRIAERIREGRS